MSINVADFPGKIWDGKSPVRTDRQDNREPDFEDWDQIVAEVIAIQTQLVEGAQTVEIVSATAFTVGPDDTNHTFQVDTNTASAVTGVKITAAAAGGNVAIAAISSGTNEGMTIDSKGTGVLSLQTLATGDIQICAVGNNLGFYGATPVALQTGVAVTEIAIHAALVSLGLITA